MRRLQVADYERMIEEQAFKRKLMEQHLEQESSGKNSNALKKRVDSTRECVRVGVGQGVVGGMRDACAFVGGTRLSHHTPPSHHIKSTQLPHG